MTGSIDPDSIPAPDVHEDALLAQWTALQQVATRMRGAARGAQQVWHGLGQVYRAPEVGALLAAMDRPRAHVATLADDLDEIALALWAFAVNGGSQAKILERARADAFTLRVDTNCDPHWTRHDHLRVENNRIHDEVDRAVTGFMAAERQCANAIEALIGGKQLHVDRTGSGNDKLAYGPASIPDNVNTPWGSHVKAEHHKSCLRSAVDHTGAFFTEFGHRTVQTVKSIGKPFGEPVDPTKTPLDHLRDDAKGLYHAAGGGQTPYQQFQRSNQIWGNLLHLHEWVTDPTKALADTTFDVLTIGLPAGAYVKGARVASDVARLGKLGTKVGETKIVTRMVKGLDGVRTEVITKLHNGRVRVGDFITGGKHHNEIDDSVKTLDRDAGDQPPAHASSPNVAHATHDAHVPEGQGPRHGHEAPVTGGAGSHGHPAPHHGEHGAGSGHDTPPPAHDPGSAGHEPPAHIDSDGNWLWKGLKLTPEQNKIADAALAARRAAYRQITEALRQIHEHVDGFRLVGPDEGLSLKGADRFKEKLAIMIEKEPSADPAALAAKINDGIRYTYEMPLSSYTSGVDHLGGELHASGFDPVKTRNAWADVDDSYQGLNSTWRDPASGQLFEVQFHTPQSLAAKELDHDTYERLSNDRTPLAALPGLRAAHRQAFASVETPAGAADIPDFRKLTES